MGCCYPSRCRLTSEEASCYSMDLILGYHKIYCYKVYKIHIEHSRNETISNESFNIIQHELGIFDVYNDTIHSILNFYSIFRADIDSFELKKLLIFSIIQSKGTLKEKSSLLFNIISAGKKIVNQADLHNFFSFVFEVFIYMITKLKLKNYLNEISPEDMAKFSLKLRAGKESSLTNLNSIYFEKQDEVDLLDFTRKTSHSLDSDFFSGHGIRSFLKDNSVTGENNLNS